MKGSVLIFLLGLLASPRLLAQDVETQYLRLQEAYSQRLQNLEQRHSRQQRELLNKFILALVRTEQSYREEGNLDGVIVSRELRDQLLQNSSVPETDSTWPDRIREMIEELGRRSAENRQNSQAELDELNQVLFRTLEPYKMEFTRQGALDKAVEIRNLQLQLAASLGVEMQAMPDLRPAPSPLHLQNPNAYPFLYEPEIFRQTPGVADRPRMIELEPDKDGSVAEESTGVLFDGGSILFEKTLMEHLRSLATRNQVMTMEFGITPAWLQQGNFRQPACIFLWGEDTASSNLALTQEGRNLFLYLKTSSPPEGRENHRVDLGQIESGKRSHFLIVFRAGEFSVYRNGMASQRLRGSLQGGFAPWTPAHVHLGNVRTSISGFKVTPWYGTLHLMALKASQDTARQAADHFSRFEQALGDG